MKRSTVSNMSGLRWARRRLQERGEVGKQRAVDDLDAGAERVDVVGEQRKSDPDTAAVISKVKPLSSNVFAVSARLSVK